MYGTRGARVDQGRGMKASIGFDDSSVTGGVYVVGAFELPQEPVLLIFHLSHDIMIWVRMPPAPSSAFTPKRGHKS